jgi:arabinofuranan 3-O-arabinosyltransferase
MSDRATVRLRLAGVGGTEIGLWLMVAVALVTLTVSSLHEMDDFNNVHIALYRFAHGFNVYQEDYSTSDPHYLYSPGATVLLSPIGFVTNYVFAHRLFSFINALAAVAAITMALRMAGVRGWQVPAVVLAALTTPPFFSSITLGNVNCLLLLALVGAFALWREDNDYPAGAVLGLIIVIKPMFAPIAVIAIAAGKWRSALSAAAVYIAAAVAGKALVPDAEAYREIVVPYVSEPRPYYNSALRGLGADYGWHPVVTGILMLIAAAAFTWAVVASYALWKKNKTDWMVVMSTATLAGVWLLSPLGQGYYSVFLLPIVLVAGRYYSPLKNGVGAFAFAGCYFPTNLGSYETNMALATAVWFLFIVGTAISLSRFSYRRPQDADSDEDEPFEYGLPPVKDEPRPVQYIPQQHGPYRQ